MLYRELIIELYKNPLNKRAMRGADITHSGVNITCGDRVRIYVKISPDKKTIENISFEGEGCAISIAAASLLTEEAQGTDIQKIMHWNLETVCEWLGIALSPLRAKCGLLPLETLQEGIRHSPKNLLGLST